MHKWWARRLGSVFRTILLYSLIDNTKPESIWNSYTEDTDLRGKIVLDPMMGGGTTVVEALRLGCKVIGGDLNPVSWFIVKKQVEEIDTEILRNSLVDIEKDLGTELRKYYKTACPECGETAEAIYYFYHKVGVCSECAKDIPLMRNFFIARSPRKTGDFVICPQCWNVFETKNARKLSKCTKCDYKFVPTGVSYSKGRRYRCIDPTCGHSEKIVHSVSESGRFRENMYAIEFYCRHCDISGNKELAKGRGYKAVDDLDRKLLKRAINEYQKNGEDLPIPDTSIPLGVETRRALNHGYKKFSDMFNPRQLLNLGKIHRWIMQIDDWNLKEFLLLAFSNSLKYNNMFAKYNATRGFITDIFRTHSFSPSMSPVEANCYDTPKGRGAFTAFVNLVIEGKEYCREPFERVHDGYSMKKIQLSPQKSWKIAQNHQKLMEDGDVLLKCGSSEHIEVPDGVADIVVTDPPYYGNVMYSELSNFFYVWLRLILKNRYRFFDAELVPQEEEVIENRYQGKGKEEFVSGLTKVFVESNRILSEDGIMVFTFHHKRKEAWGALLRTVLDSGFYIVTTYPVRSEMKASTHLHDLENIVYDMILVCRKQMGEPKSRTWRSIKSSVGKSVLKMIKRLEREGESPSSEDTFTMILGKSLELYSKHYPKVSENGEVVDPENALETLDDLLGSL
jgi:adenine-specific DNA methylase